MKKGKHRYLYYLCEKHNLTLQELYKRDDLMTRSLKHELFRLLKEQKKQEANHGG